jgi:hypothetical protein
MFGLKLETAFDFFILFVILVKTVFFITFVGHALVTRTGNKKLAKYDDKLLYWRDRTEFIFLVSMSLLLIYHFRPRRNVPVSYETSILFYLFGWILIFTANWREFFENTRWIAKK